MCMGRAASHLMIACVIFCGWPTLNKFGCPRYNEMGAVLYSQQLVFCVDYFSGMTKELLVVKGISTCFLSYWILLEFLQDMIIVEQAYYSGLTVRNAVFPNILLLISYQQFSCLYWYLPTLLVNLTCRLRSFSLPLQFVAHWLACIWSFLGSIQDPPYGMGTWAFEIIDYNESPSNLQYLTCMYWALTTMSTIGYGDLVPQSTSEKSFVIFSMFLGSVIYAYGITQVVTIFSNLDLASVRFKDRMDLLYEYMDHKGLPLELKDDLRTFYLFKRDHSCSFYR